MAQVFDLFETTETGDPIQKTEDGEADEETGTEGSIIDQSCQCFLIKFTGK